MAELLACPFCQIDASRVAHQNALAFWTKDGFPVSPGHSLVIPKRHFASFFDATLEEREALLVLLDHAKASVASEHQPDGFNIGINDGVAAGQTVPHLHIHLIPRYAGDVPDPRGGVRWLMPDKADYWTQRS